MNPKQVNSRKQAIMNEMDNLKKFEVHAPTSAEPATSVLYLSDRSKTISNVVSATCETGKL